MVDQPVIVGADGNPIGRNVVPLGISFDTGYQPGVVMLRVRPSRQPMSPVEIAAINRMIAEGMATGYKLSPEGAIGLAKGLRKAARAARKASVPSVKPEGPPPPMPPPAGDNGPAPANRPEPTPRPPEVKP